MDIDLEAHRRFLFAIAYRMLGSATEAEDVVQDAFVRCLAAPQTNVDSPRAWLATMVTRLCLNRLQSARQRRETYVGPWLPEPVSSDTDPPPLELHESLSVAFLVLLEQLSPLERAVFLLREVFDHDYAEISTIVERTPEACRQLFARARQHLAANRPRFPPTRDQHRALVVRFGECVMGGDLTGLVDLLASDVVLEADSNGRVRGALLAPLRGRDAVATFVLRTPKLPGGPFRTELGRVNGEPALVLLGATDGDVRGVVALEVDAGRVRAIRVIANPEKLSRLTAGAA